MPGNKMSKYMAKGGKYMSKMAKGGKYMAKGGAKKVASTWLKVVLKKLLRL